MKTTGQNGAGATPRRKFDETYQRHAVELTLLGGRTIKAVAEELGITPWTLYRWREHYAPALGLGGGTMRPRTLEESEEENRRLRAEVIRLRAREIVLKKSLGLLSETPESGRPRSQR
jgi:transposase-like protein